MTRSPENQVVPHAPASPDAAAPPSPPNRSRRRERRVQHGQIGTARSKKGARKRRGRGGNHPPHFTVKQVAKALAAARGSYAGAARKLGCARQTVQNYCQREPELYVACVQARETLLDDAEDALVALIAKRDLGAICFFLKTQGKARGYVERAEHAVTYAYDFSRLSDEELLSLGPLMAKLRGGPPPLPLTAGEPPPPPPGEAHAG